MIGDRQFAYLKTFLLELKYLKKSSICSDFERVRSSFALYKQKYADVFAKKCCRNEQHLKKVYYKSMFQIEHYMRNNICFRIEPRIRKHRTCNTYSIERRIIVIKQCYLSPVDV